MNAPAAGSRFRALGLYAFPLGGKQELVFAEASGVTRTLHSSDVDLLMACGTFRTLEEHAREICRETGMPAEQAEALRGQLSDLAKAGFLQSLEQVLERCRGPEGNAAPAPPSIGSVGILTRDRTECLERALRGYVENAVENGRRPRFAVMDDSARVESRERVLGLLGSLKSRYGLEFRYAGPEEKSRFVRALVKEGGFPTEVVEFALGDPEGCGIGTGANRNALLLETLGERFVSVDDDTECRLARVPGSAPFSLSLSSDDEPLEFWCHNDRAAALGAVRFEKGDFLALHEDLLGRPAADCVADQGVGARVDFDRIDARLFGLLGSGLGTVRLTQCGLVGDRATSVPAWLTVHVGPSLQRLIGSGPEYGLVRWSGEGIRGVPCVTLSNRPFFMGHAAGFDNRDLLPPFMPVLRGQDGLFAHTLRKCFDRSLIGHVPWLVVHSPPERRSSVAEGVARLNSSDLLLACLQSLELGSAKPEGPDRLRALGMHLAELGSLPARDFDALLLRLVWLRTCQRLEALDTAVAGMAAAAPSWVADLRLSMGKIREAMPEPGYAVASDLLEGRGSDRARELVRKLVLRLGGLLQAWTSLVEAARDLKRRGMSPARTV